MALPFSQTEFFGVFAAYNEAVWPAQLVLYALAVGAVVAAAGPGRRRGVAVSGILAFFWTWIAVVYHWLHFSDVNPAARVFGGFFLIQAALFVWTGVARARLAFERPGGWRGVVGALLIAYALAVYPLIGLTVGHPARELPAMGVPCPTTILTLGLLFWARRPFPRSLLAIPVVWSAIGGTAAFALGVPQDLGLLAAGLLALTLLRRGRGTNALENG